MARVVLAYDGSDLALAAAERGLALLGSGAERVTMVRVVPPVLAPLLGSAAVPATAVPAADDLDRMNQAAVEDAQQEAATAAAGLPGEVEVEVEVLVGDPAHELCRFAAEEPADVLVAGSHGSGWLKRAVLGSVSHYLVQHAPCPVLVVRATQPRDG